MLNWTEAGREYTEGKERELEAVFGRCEWQEIREDGEVAAMPGMAINNIIRQVRGRPLRYAISRELALEGGE